MVTWYRASQSCPSGTEFVSGIRVDGRTVRLARAGDRVDYVVTLDSDGASSSGRLERQTARGTIAITELRGGPCREVAEALALSLALAVTPVRAEESPQASPETDAGPRAVSQDVPPALPTEPPLGTAPEAARSQAPSFSTSEAAQAPAGSPSAAAPQASLVAPGLALGGGLEGALGVTPQASFGGSLFVEYAWSAWSSRWPTSVRLGPGVRYSRTSVDGLGRITQWTTALRLELCPLRPSGTTFGVAPCIGGEGGVFVARSERNTALTSANFWTAVGPALRVTARVGSQVSLGVTSAVMAPISRQEITAGSEVLYRTPPAVFSLGADVFWAVQ